MNEVSVFYGLTEYKGTGTSAHSFHCNIRMGVGKDYCNGSAKKRNRGSAEWMIEKNAWRGW